MDHKNESPSPRRKPADLLSLLFAHHGETLAPSAYAGTGAASSGSPALPCEGAASQASEVERPQPPQDHEQCSPSAHSVAPRAADETPQRNGTLRAGAAASGEACAFSLGARGECVAALQHALGLRADGRFGPRTYEAVAAIEPSLGREARGLADRHVFAAVGLAWPTEFDRTLALVIELEGTSYGDCNTLDIDGAGLTMGICGFTTRHGEVQALIETFLREAPDGWSCMAPSLQRQIRQLIDAAADAAQWERVLLDEKRRPRRTVQQTLAAWGTHPVMQALQREWARERFWQPACRAARRLGVDEPAGRGLLFDVWVQNGGWRAAHDTHLERIAGCPFGEIPPGDRLRIMALAVAAAARGPWRADVLSRKLLFARGAGMVHGTFYSLAAQAILARSDLAPRQ